MYHFLSVCDLTIIDWTVNHWTKIHISKSMTPSVTKFGQSMYVNNPSTLKVKVMGQRSRSLGKKRITGNVVMVKVKVTWAEVKGHKGQCQRSRSV